MAWIKATPGLLVVGARVRNLTPGWFTPLIRDDEEFNGEKQQAWLPVLSEGRVWLLDGRQVHVDLEHAGEAAWWIYDSGDWGDMDTLEVWRED
jgi:hypothetical protein